MERRDRRVNEAEALALRDQRKAEADALRIVREADAALTAKVETAKAEQAAFLARVAASRLTEGQERALWCAAWQETAPQGTLADVLADYLQRRRDGRSRL